MWIRRRRAGRKKIGRSRRRWEDHVKEEIKERETNENVMLSTQVSGGRKFAPATPDKFGLKPEEEKIGDWNKGAEVENRKHRFVKQIF